MHHDAAAPVTRLLAGLIAGRPRRDGWGLTVVPLEGGREPDARADGRDLEVTETTPPTPAALWVANSGPGAATVHTGDLFTGGLAGRAARAPVVVEAGSRRTVGVEAVEARWWWTGPPVLAGTLDPPRSALVALAALDGAPRGGLAAIARTSLWALEPGVAEPAETTAEVPPPAALIRGWVLLAGTRVLAVRIWGRRRAMDLPGPARSDRARAAQQAARHFLAAVSATRWNPTGEESSAAEVDGHHLHAVHRDGVIVELGAVRLSDELIQALRSDPVSG